MNALKLHQIRQASINKVLAACQHLLYSSEAARITREYLNSRVPLKHQFEWGFGYFPDDAHLSDLTKFVTPTDLSYMNLCYTKFLEGGLGGKTSHGHFSEHNLIMPFRNVHGDVVALLGRSLLTEEVRQERLVHKYKYSTGCKKEYYVYGLDKARDAIIDKNFVICVEGQFDCISLHTHGIKNVVAFGCSNISVHQMFQIHRYTNNIVLMFDNDEAGQKAKKKSKSKYKDIANIKLISPPSESKDIDEFFRSSKDAGRINVVIDTLRGLGDKCQGNQIDPLDTNTYSQSNHTLTT